MNARLQQPLSILGLPNFYVTDDVILFRYSAQTVAIYFGTSMVTMSAAEGSVHSYKTDCVTNPASPDLFAVAKSRYSPASIAKCDSLLYPALPRADLLAKYVKGFRDTVHFVCHIITINILLYTILFHYTMVMATFDWYRLQSLNVLCIYLVRVH